MTFNVIWALALYANSASMKVIEQCDGFQQYFKVDKKWTGRGYETEKLSESVVGGSVQHNVINCFHGPFQSEQNVSIICPTL